MDKSDCDCNILKLSEGSKQLKTLEQNTTNDYIYLKCYICKKFGDYFDNNYIFCIECEKEYCSECVKIKEIFKCECNILNYNINTDIKCKDCEYYYCILCTLSNCLYCDVENDNNTCPKCEVRIKYDNILFCQTHYDIKEYL